MKPFSSHIYLLVLQTTSTVKEANAACLELCAYTQESTKEGIWSGCCLETWDNHHCTADVLSSGNAKETPKINFSQWGEISLRLNSGA